MNRQTLLEFLRDVPVFSGLADADLAELVQECGVVDLAPNTVLFEEGAVGDAAYVIRSGQIDILKRSGKRDVLLGRLNIGDLFGEMALLDDSPRMASAQSHGQTQVVAIRKDEVQALMSKSLAIQNAMFDLVLARLKSTEAQLRQSERMVQLATLSAGIAHELNNPAAAAQRAVGQLSRALEEFGSANRAFTRGKIASTIIWPSTLAAISSIRSIQSCARS